MGWVLEGWIVVGKKGVGLEGKGEKKKDEMKEKLEKVVASKQEEHDRLRSVEGCPVDQAACIYGLIRQDLSPADMKRETVQVFLAIQRTHSVFEIDITSWQPAMHASK